MKTEKELAERYNELSSKGWVNLTNEERKEALLIYKKIFGEEK